MNDDLLTFNSLDVQKEKKTKSFCIGESIITPYARYVKHGKYKEFHSIINPNTARISFRKGEKIITPNFITLNCTLMDESGFCMGHEITREQFIEKWCDGIEPPQLEDLEEDEENDEDIV